MTKTNNSPETMDRIVQYLERSLEWAKSQGINVNDWNIYLDGLIWYGSDGCHDVSRALSIISSDIATISIVAIFELSNSDRIAIHSYPNRRAVCKYEVKV